MLCGGNDRNDRQESFDEDTIDKIVAEGRRLKCKCRSLRQMLLETEMQRQEERAQFLHQLHSQAEEHEHALASIRAQHYFELAERDNEEQLCTSCEHYRQLQVALEELALQNSLIATLTNNAIVQQQQQNMFEEQRGREPPEESAMKYSGEKEKQELQDKLHKTIDTLRSHVKRLSSENTTYCEENMQLKFEQERIASADLATPMLIRRGEEWSEAAATCSLSFSLSFCLSTFIFLYPVCCLDAGGVQNEVVDPVTVSATGNFMLMYSNSHEGHTTE